MTQKFIKLFSKRPLNIRSLSGTLCYGNDNKGQNNTIDEKEILHFQQLRENWWDEEGELKPLHSMNELRIPFIRDCLKNREKLESDFVNSSEPLKNINILDVGCGGGILSEPLAQLGAIVTGIDATKDLIECSKLHAKENSELKNEITYIHGTVENLVEKYNSKFDVVVSSECIEHVIAQETFLKCCTEVLKPGGSLFITTLNKTMLSWLLGIIASEYLLKLIPKGTHDWNKFISPHEVQRLLEKYNCQTCVIHGLTYNFLNNKWYWIPNTSVNYCLHAVKDY